MSPSAGPSCWLHGGAARGPAQAGDRAHQARGAIWAARLCGLHRQLGCKASRASGTVIRVRKLCGRRGIVCVMDAAPSQAAIAPARPIGRIKVQADAHRLETLAGEIAGIVTLLAKPQISANGAGPPGSFLAARRA